MARDEKRFTILHTTAECSAGKRDLYREFLEDRMTRAAKRDLEAHAKHCLACAVLVANRKALEAASRHYRLPVGVQLSAHLDLVPLVKPCSGTADPNWAKLIRSFRSELKRQHH